jgi:hypothetical protein
VAEVDAPSSPESSVKLLRKRGFETIDPLHSVGMSFFDVLHMIAHEL